MKRWIELMVCLLLAGLTIAVQASAANAPAIMVGRVYAIEGDLLRYVPEEKDWVPMVKDSPFGTEDALFSGKQGMAEMIIPNGTWIRIGQSTQIQFIALDSDLSEMDVAEGVARFYNKGSETVIKVTCPFGYVLAYPGTVFDFYAGENSVEVIAVKGKVSFVHTATDARYDAAAGSPSILADASQVSSGDTTVDPDWNAWNRTRENFWAAKARMRGRSAEYLPPDLRDESYALEENGRWESVPYEGSPRWFWRPTTITVGWSPFTAGRWTDWNGDQVWIPAEPFGYITHHYGNWIYTRNSWYWAPPVVSVRVGLPLLAIGFFWSPGRVSWIHHDNYVGWVPLAPRETYYSHRNWGGPHEVVVTNVNVTRININIRSYAYAGHAVVVPRENFYRENNYRNVRVTNINSTTIINNYRAAPVVNNTVINNYTTNKERYTFTNRAAQEKPHNTVINRIEKNAPVIEKGRKDNAVAVRERVNRLPEGKVKGDVRIETPKSTNYIVPANEVNRPKAEIKLQQREIKTGGKPSQPAGPRQVSPAQPVRPDEPAARPERVTPVKPPPQERLPQPARPERVIPAQPPARPEQPAARPERVTPVKPPPQERLPQPARPERVIPAQPPARPEQPAARPERVAPVKPPPQERLPQPARPERVIPAQPPARPEQPAARPERVAPVKPPPQERLPQPARPERVIPAQPPARPEQPAARPERVAPVKPPPQERLPQPARPERVIPAQPPARPEQPAARPERVAPVKPAQPEKPHQPAEREKVNPAEKDLEKSR